MVPGTLIAEAAVVSKLIHRFLVWLITGKTSRHGSLREFDIPANYEEILTYNLADVERLLDTPRLVELQEMLCEYTGLREDQMRAVIARLLLVGNEWNREAYSHRSIGIWAYFLLRTIGAVVRGVRRSEYRPVQVAFGEWPTGGQGSYTYLGYELDQRGISHDTIDVTQHDVADLRTVLRGVIAAVRLIRLLRRIAVDQQITLHSICAQIVLEQIIGDAWGKRFGAGVLFTALDNGSLLVRSHAAGMKLVLAQNGIRCGSDASFIVAYHYLSLEPTHYDASLLSSTGIFDLVPAGSLSLANQGVNDFTNGARVQFDILIISQFSPTAEWAVVDSTWGHIFLTGEILQSTRMIVDYARERSLRIAFYPRAGREFEGLIAKGLDLNNVHCFDRRETTLFQAISTAECTLSCFSTASFEAMLIGKTAGFVYASPNMAINQYARDNGLLYSSPDPSGLDTFLRDLPNRQPVKGPFIVHPDKTLKIMADVIESALVSADSTSASIE